jgi:translation initiation factor 3 subunit H
MFLFAKASRPAASASLGKGDDAAESAEDRRLDLVLLDVNVMLRIAKHCRDNAPESVTGQLLGIDGKHDVEISACFPFPNAASSETGVDVEEDADAGTEYQMEMMRCLREVNVDAYTVGWYQTAELSSFSNETLLETQFNYQTNPLLSRKCVALVYDPIMTLQTGQLHVRALRLSHAFCELYGKVKMVFVSLVCVMCPLTLKLPGS